MMEMSQGCALFSQMPNEVIDERGFTNCSDGGATR